MRPHLLLAVVALASVLGGANALAANRTVRLVYTGELRGSLAETVIGGVPFGGLARVATWAENATTSAPLNYYVVPIDVGSWLGSNPADRVVEGNVTADVLEGLGFMARAIGVSDLQLGPDVLARSLASSSIPSILSNAVIASRHPLAAHVRRFHCFNVTSGAGATMGVGVIAALPSDSCGFSTCYDSRGTVVELRDHMIYLQKAYDDMLLANPWVQFVVCILGRPVQYSTIVALTYSIRGPSAFVVVGNDYHFSNAAVDITTPTHTFPLVLDSATPNRKAIVGSARSYQYGHVIDLTVNSAGDPILWSGGPVMLQGCVAQSLNAPCFVNNASVDATVSALSTSVSAYMTSQAGRTIASLNASTYECYFSECSLGSAVADAIRWKQRDFCEVALVPASALHGIITAGNFSVASVSSVVTPANIASLSIPGAVLINMLQYAVAVVPSNSSAHATAYLNATTGRFLQVSGMKFAFDATKPAGNRILSLETLNIDDSYSEVTAKRVYHVCTLDYVRRGGEGFTMLTGQDSVYKPFDKGPELAGVVADFFSANSPVNYTQLSRVSVRLLDTTVDVCKLDASKCGGINTNYAPKSDDTGRVVAITVPVVGSAVLLGAGIAFTLRLRLARKIATMKSEEKRMKKHIPYDELEFGAKRGTPVAIKKCIDLENAFRKLSLFQKGALATEGGQRLGTVQTRTLTARFTATNSHMRTRSRRGQVTEDIMDAVETFEEEIAIMSSLRHPNVLLYMGTCPPPNLCIVTEYMKNGSLDSILHSEQELAWDRRFNMAQDVALGMSYLHLHDPPILHCDLKSMNILVDANWVAKVSDFGLTRLKAATAISERVGTLWWMAPEVLKGTAMTEKCDVYSYGVLLWELADRHIPYEEMFVERGVVDDNDIERLLEDISDGLRLTVPHETPPAFASLMERCWAQNPEARPSFTLVASELTSRAEFDDRWKPRGAKRVSVVAM